MYVGGTQVATLPFSAVVPAPDASEPLVLGAEYDNTGTVCCQLEGRLDEVRLYRRALSAEEIARLASR